MAHGALPFDTLFQRLLHAVVIGWACIVAAALLLGAMGALTPGPLLARADA